MTTVTYIPRDEPAFLEEGRWGRQFLYGAYRVVLDDGWTLLSPHTATEGTVSVEPVDLDLNPHFRDALVQQAEALHPSNQ